MPMIGPASISGGAYTNYDKSQEEDYQHAIGNHDFVYDPFTQPPGRDLSTPNQWTA
jgi:hypothetical protein